MSIKILRHLGEQPPTRCGERHERAVFLRWEQLRKEREQQRAEVLECV